MLPINYESWHQIPDSNKNQALDNIKEKLKDKKAEYEAVASSDNFVNLDDIDNRIITEVLGPERYSRVQFQGSGVIPIQYFGFSSQQYMPSRSQAQAKVLRLKDQMAQMQASMLNLKQRQHREKLRFKENMKNSSYNLKRRQQRGKQSRKYDALQLQLQNMMKIFQ